VTEAGLEEAAAAANMSLSDSSSHGAGGFRTFRQTSRDRKSLVLLFLLLLLLLAQQQQQAAFHHQCRE
jgi:hypothetical protein